MTTISHSEPVRLEFVVRPPLGAEPNPGSGEPNGHCSVRHGPPSGRRRRSMACGPSTTRGFAPRFCRPGSRQVSAQDHGHSSTAHSRDILAVSSRSGVPRMSVTEAHEGAVLLALTGVGARSSRTLGEPRSTFWPSWRQQVHDLDMTSRVHPQYKTKYHVGHWPAYDRALVQRGDITVWLAPDAVATWEAVGVGARGGQRQYSDLAIETALTLRLIFHLPLRQTEGFLTSIFGMLGLDLSAPDHTTTLTAWPASRPHASSLPRGCQPASPRRQHGPLDRGRG